MAGPKDHSLGSLLSHMLGKRNRMPCENALEDDSEWCVPSKLKCERNVDDFEPLMPTARKESQGKADYQETLPRDEEDSDDDPEAVDPEPLLPAAGTQAQRRVNAPESSSPPVGKQTQLKMDEIESSSLPLETKIQLGVVLKSLIGVCNDVPAEQRKEIIAQLEKFSRSANSQLCLHVKAEPSDDEPGAKRPKMTTGEDNERGSHIRPSMNWGNARELCSITTPLSKHLTASRLNDIMRRFRDQLVEPEEVTEVYERANYANQWMPARATSLANYIFVVMPGGMHLCLRNSLIRTGQAARLHDHELGQDNNLTPQTTPPLIATLLYYISEVRTFQSFKNFAFWHLARDWHLYKLFSTYQELKRRVDAHDEHLIQYLQSQINTQPRYVWNTSILDIFLVEALKFRCCSEEDRAKTYRRGKVLFKLVEVFGEGGIGFLGYNSAEWLGAWEGKTDVQHAWKLLDRLCPELRELAQLVDERILQPLKNGNDVTSGPYADTVQGMLENIQGWRAPLELRNPSF